MAILPRIFSFVAPKGTPAALRVSPALVQAAHADLPAVYETLRTSPNGLTQEEVDRRIEEQGRNIVAQEKRHTRLTLLGHAIVNPLVILLLVLAGASVITGDNPSAIVMGSMVVLGVVLRFFQEARADTAAAKLKAMINVTATVMRDGAAREVPLSELVPGDVVRLAAGDMIPADVRIISAKDLFIVQAALTGESIPVEKSEALLTASPASPLDTSNVCFLGTSVESGAATAVIVCTGRSTYLGNMSGLLSAPAPPSAFDKGLNSFTWLMIRFMLVMTPLVFIINGLTKHDWGEAFFFALAVAVGLTPEMLPMIVSVCLSKGAIVMSRKKVIVKRLNSIQNFGAMDILCTDKTGTLTQDRVMIERHCDVVRREDDEVLTLCYLNSYFQTGLKNVLDRAVLEHREIHLEVNIPEWSKVDEIPFDFSRRVMSVVVETPQDTHRIITKGAPEEIFKRCSQFELNGKLHPMQPILIQDLRDEYEELSSDGFRVLSVAYKDVPRKPAYSKADECDMVLRGYVAFLDPPKDTAAKALAALASHGVTAKILTGDNELVSRKICSDVGLATDVILLGSQLETMTDEQLGIQAEKITLFARMSPSDKARVIRCLQARGHVVGFLGDGMNDAPGLRAADVGISVDTAVDIARESADVILLEKSLMVLEEGVIEGRKVYANILKYVRMGASSNFGNMFSVIGASFLLPFLPMLPIQILILTLLYDFSQIPIPTDDVDPELVARPRPWVMSEISRFILFIGPISSIFDYSTYFVMLYVFGCYVPTAFHERLFHTGWFIESLLTQTLIIHVIRTNRFPFLQSRASWPLIVTTTVVMIFGMWLPFSPFASAMGFEKVTWLYWPIIAATLLAYIVLTQQVKSWLLRRHFIS